MKEQQQALGVGVAALGLCYASGFLSGSKTTALAAVLAACGVVSMVSLNSKSEDGNDTAEEKGKVAKLQVPSSDTLTKDSSDEKMVSLRVIYATTTGTAKAFAEKIQRDVFAMHVSGFMFDVSIVDIASYDQDNLEQEELVVFLMPTWTDGVPPATANIFCTWLKDLEDDFRVSRTFLQNVQFAVMGLGNSEYDEHYCTAARNLDNTLQALGASPLCVPGEADDMVDQWAALDSWSESALLPALAEHFAKTRGAPANSTFASSAVDGGQAVDASSNPSAGCGSSCGSGGKSNNTKSGGLSKAEYKKMKAERKAKGLDPKPSSGLVVEPVALEEEDRINDLYLHMSDRIADATGDTDTEEDGEPDGGEGVVDLEDLGTMMKSDAEEGDLGAVAPGTEREMVTPLQRKALTKEGYRILGSHSAVKLCRWTKHQLRGRGGCYKHTCYGIVSYQCMETTPSLACANKCVFCWRHHKNPVGREWRWKTDAPEMLVDQSIAQHCAMIKQMKGVPGVIPERLAAAFKPAHCALSLVGEPIMYPHINQFCRLLHERRISTFLVTNAQFPDKIAALEPVTQLYVSIDAATKESLRAVDRPLFKDFWERFLRCLDELHRKRQRTVYRLTLVKQWNMEDGELDQYVELIERGQPDLIEVKAVTYCGKSDGSSLTMQNVPWHREVRAFCEALTERLNARNPDSYGLAAEHSHSCLVLVGSTRLRGADGGWRTWIDYDRFHELMADYYANGTTFTTDQYTAPTPSWGLYNSKEEGFDPVETRFRRTKDGKVTEIEYKASSSGCG